MILQLSSKYKLYEHAQIALNILAELQECNNLLYVGFTS